MKIPMKLSADFSAGTSQAKKQWDNILKVLKENKKMTTTNIIPGKAVLQSEGSIKTFPN